MHGQYFKSIDRWLVSEDDTFVWMLRGDMKAETGSEIISAQGLALHITCNKRITNRNGI